MGIPDSIDWIPGLPEELGLECLTRIPYSDHPTASRVCRPWRALLQSKDFYYHRMTTGHTLKVACLVQALPHASGDPKPNGLPGYGITVFDPENITWTRLDPIPKYPDGVPVFCQLASCEGKLVVIGGLDPVTYNPVCDVSVYDFTTCRWKKGKDMPSKRSFFAVGSSGSRVYVAGGHDEGKNALDSAWVYDLTRDEWTELTRMTRARDECHGAWVGEDEFWVVSGYGTESQGEFENGADVMDIGSGQWRRVEGAWPQGECPRACGGEVGKDGKLVSWAGLGREVRVGTRGVRLGKRVVVMGSEHDGAKQGVYMVEEGQNGKLERVDVPDEFSGFVQSGCCIEI